MRPFPASLAAACLMLTTAQAQDTAPRTVPDRLSGNALEDAPIRKEPRDLEQRALASAIQAGSPSIGTNFCGDEIAPVLFADDFESADLIAGGWAIVGIPTTTEVDDAPGGGKWIAGLLRGDRIIKHMSTVGVHVASVRFDARVPLPFAQGHFLAVDCWDGSMWHTIFQEESTGYEWQSFERLLPQEALDNPDFRLRFRKGGLPPLGSWAGIDNVSIEARGIGHIEAFGSTSIADNDVTLVASGIPADTFGGFFFGPDQAAIPMGLGIRCVGGMGRQRLFPLLQADASGTVSRRLDFTTHPVDSSFLSSGPVTGYFQFWFREHGRSSLTDALELHLTQ